MGSENKLENKVSGLLFSSIIPTFDPKVGLSDFVEYSALLSFHLPCKVLFLINNLRSYK